MSSVEYSPFSEDVLSDPFPTYDRLREVCPVHHFPDFGDEGFFSVTRHADVLALSKDIDRWSAEWGQGPIYVKEGGLRSDPPEHTVYRRLITGFFTPARTVALRPFVESTVSELIARFVEDGQVELISQFASPLPMNVISHVLGVPPERRADFKAWSDDFMAAQNNADPAVQAAARAKIDAFFDDELTSRRKRLGATEHGQPLPDDALTSLLRATNDDGTSFANEQLLPLLLLLLVGGNETTTTMIGSLVRRLLEHDLWNAVAEDDRLLDAAIEESLRFDPPVLGLFRTARGEQLLHGVTIPDRAKVHGLYAAANRDPEVWNDPNQFRLDRSPAKARQHLSFGAGIWVCPAAGVARMEAAVAVRCLARRLPTARIDGPVERTDSFMMWGPKSLPIAWDA